MPTLNLIINAAKAKAGAAIFNKSAKSIEKSSKKAGMGIKGLLAAVGGFAIIRKAVKVWAEYELTMKTLKGVTGATEEQFKRLSETARLMGSTTQFSAKEAGEGLLFLARAGFTADEAIKSLPATLDLAVTAMLDLGQAADIVSNVMAPFGIRAEETSRVVDVLTVTANNANTTVSQLAEAMKMAAPIMGVLGITVEETAAAIGILGNSGIQASLAGTNLRGMMAALIGPTEGAENALRKMGLSLEDINPEKHDLTEIFKKFQAAGAGASEMLAIFGRRNVGAALTLANSSDELQKLTDKTNESAGATAKLAAEMRDSLSGSMKGLNSAFEEMLLSAGDSGLLGVFRTTVDVMADVIRMFSGGTAQMQEMQLMGILLSEVFQETWQVMKFLGLQAFDALRLAASIVGNVLQAEFLLVKTVVQSVFTSIQQAGNILWAVLKTGFQVVFDDIKDAARSVIDTILGSSVLIAVFDKMGVSVQNLADARQKMMTSGTTATFKMQKNMWEATKANRVLQEELEEGRTNDKAAMGLEIEKTIAIATGMDARRTAHTERMKQINEIAQAQIEAVGSAGIGGSGGLSPADQAEADAKSIADEKKKEDAAVLAMLLQDEEDGARRAKIDKMLEFDTLEEEQAQAKFEAKMERMAEEKELELKFIEESNVNLFASEEEKELALEKIKAKFQDRAFKMTKEHKDAEMKLDAKTARMRLQGASQFLEAAAVLSEAFGSGSLANSKAFGIAQAGVSTAIGIARALELGFPAAIPAMALAAATGVAQIAAITSGAKGSATISAPSGGLGSGGAAGAAQAEQAESTANSKQPTEIDFRISGLEPNQLVTGEMVESIFNKMDELIDDDFKPRNIVVSR